MHSSPLSALSQIISSGISTIESTYATHGATFPSLDEPFRPPTFDDPGLLHPTQLVIAAAAQLIASLSHPASSILDGASAHYITSSLGVVADTNVAEVLREAGPQGLHIRDIGERCGTDSSKIGRVLRFLATLHIFREVSPDVFANNRISSIIDTGKTIEDIKARPLEKYDDTPGISALIGHFADEGIKSASYVLDSFRDTETLSSQDPLAAPFNRAFNAPMHFFEWCELPENELRFRRFGATMKDSISTVTPDTALAGLDWKSLKKDSLVVDVGGGIGSTTGVFAKAFPHLRFVIQDRSAVVAEGIQRWKQEYPEALIDNRVRFQEHNFFEPQPIKDASVFFLRFITHDWPTEYARKILKHLGDAALPTTKLVIMDNIVPYSVPGNSGTGASSVPYPLLANLGRVNFHSVRIDMHMMALHNSQERTVGQFQELVEGTGWKLESISTSSAGTMSSLVFAHISQ
ncbi:hypothetical protein PILCRDRAFT_8864 [Piloderma croceum F 1598]|uniref:O-methyltransferase C-terminal domain-containing protein n=1 Tax=Piloderma croceum (strain F 1598) TaxID=765440 RepID=A0A0C3FN82_PILCF|nr:hypothetical protein PILCRDRAFT_8864 [Piloderma croceum F 1598]